MSDSLGAVPLSVKAKDEIKRPGPAEVIRRLKQISKIAREQAEKEPPVTFEFSFTDDSMYIVAKARRLKGEMLFLGQHTDVILIDDIVRSPWDDIDRSMHMAAHKAAMKCIAAAPTTKET